MFKAGIVENGSVYYNKNKNCRATIRYSVGIVSVFEHTIQDMGDNMGDVNKVQGRIRLVKRFKLVFSPSKRVQMKKVRACRKATIFMFFRMRSIVHGT